MKTLYSSLICAGAFVLGLGIGRSCYIEIDPLISRYLSCYESHFKTDDGKLMKCVAEVRERACRGKQDTPDNLFDEKTGRPLTERQKCLDQQQELEVQAARLYHADRFK